MLEREIELSVGDVVRIGEYTVTVVDVDGLEVSFKIDSSESDDVHVVGHQTAVGRGH